MAVPKFQEEARGHLAALSNLIDRGSIPRLRRIYRDAQVDLERKLARAVGVGAAPFTIQKHRALLAQAKQGLAELGKRLGSTLGEETARTQEVSAQRLIAEIKRLERRATGAAVQLPIEQAARLAGVLDPRKSSLLKMNKTSMARYGASIVGKIEGALAQSLVQGETGFAAIDRVTEAYDMEWWRAERIVRTEVAQSYNTAQADALRDTAQVMPDLMMRWTELVADVSLIKLDARVGDDSVAMHGQLAKPGGEFRMPSVAPPGLKISPSLLGRSWANPPNRPNDRSLVQPWRPGWRIWGWEFVGGEKVYR